MSVSLSPVLLDGVFQGGPKIAPTKVTSFFTTCDNVSSSRKDPAACHLVCTVPRVIVKHHPMLLSTGWVLWFLCTIVVFFQILSTTINSTQPHLFNESAQRYLEEGADEDDRYVNGDGSMGVDLEHHSDWYNLDHWLDSTSLMYDIIEGFLYVADAFFIAWILWGCLVHCGICPDHRLNRKRRTRMVKDGRGVFAPLKDFDAFASDHDDDDDDKSRESMEYGDGHEDDDEYGNIDVRKEEEKIAKAAEEFFSKAEKKKRSLKNGKGKKRNATNPDETMLLDLEMPEQHHEKQRSGDVIFL